MSNTNNIIKQGCLVHFTSSVWGGRVKLPSPNITTEADPQFVRAIKYLIDREYLKPIEEVRNRARHYVYGKTLPFPIPSVMFVPKKLIATIDKKLGEMQADFNDKTSHFVLRYNEAIENSKEKLKGLFIPSDYPLDVSKKFSFFWQFISIDSPGKSHILEPEIYEREKQRFDNMVEEFRETAVTTLRTTFAEMVNRIAARLTSEKKIFRDSLIGNIKEFFNDFEALNISDDKELASQVEKCKKILSGVSIEAVRSNEGLRSSITGNISEIHSAVSKLMKDRPARILKFVKENAA